MTLIGAGRMGFAYPDFARDIINDGRMYPEKVCVGCSACTQIMRDNGRTGCVVRDNEVYGPIFRRGRMSDKDNLLRLAAACRKCQEPTCQLGCPAGIEIPQFITLFLEGKEREAYETIRKANVFPEVCAWLCPVEQQCQGNCLQGFLGDGPLPIADIQRYLATAGEQERLVQAANPRESQRQEGRGHRGRSRGSGLCRPAPRSGPRRDDLRQEHRLRRHGRSRDPSDRQAGALKSEIAAIFADVPKDRMILSLGKELDSRNSLDTILAQGFDAAFIGLGLPQSVSVAKKRLAGLWNAMDFLSSAKQANGLALAGKSVAVIGGGNTAMDVAVTAARSGAKDVYVIYRRSFKEMPAWGAERDRAIGAGVHFLILTQPLEYTSNNGTLTGMKLCPTRLGEPDRSGRRTA